MSLVPTDNAAYQEYMRQRLGATAPTGDWFEQNAPTQTTTQPAAPTSYGGDPEALTRQYYAQNPYGGNIAGLYDFLKQHGVNAEYVDHRGQPSADKLWINGRMIDVVGSSDSPDAHWAYNDVTAQHYAAQGGGPTASQGATSYTPGAFGSLTQGWAGQFKSPGNFTAPTLEQATNSPGFQFRLREGLGALERSAAAKGTLLTGGTAKDLNSWAQDYASSEYDKVYGRALGENNLQYGRAWNEDVRNQNTFYQNQDNQYSRYMGLAGLGQNSASNLGAYGSSYMNQGNDLITGAGNAQAAGTVGSANAWGPLYGAGGDFLSGLLR